MIRKIKATAMRFCRDEAALTAIEYAIIGALFVIVVILSVKATGMQLRL